MALPKLEKTWQYKEVKQWPNEKVQRFAKHMSGDMHRNLARSLKQPLPPPALVYCSDFQTWHEPYDAKDVAYCDACVVLDPELPDHQKFFAIYCLGGLQALTDLGPFVVPVGGRERKPGT